MPWNDPVDILLSPNEFDLDGCKDKGVEAKIPCKAKIAKLCPAVAVKQNILWLDVPECRVDKKIYKTCRGS